MERDPPVSFEREELLRNMLLEGISLRAIARLLKVSLNWPAPRWGNHFWGRGYFSSTSGNVTDDIINEYIDNHTDAHRSDNQSNISLE